jgi:hypothetical protein
MGSETVSELEGHGSIACGSNYDVWGISGVLDLDKNESEEGGFVERRVFGLPYPVRQPACLQPIVIMANIPIKAIEIILDKTLMRACCVLSKPVIYVSARGTLRHG